MNSIDAFALSCGGVVTENQMSQYAQYVNVGVQQAKAMGGWISKQAEATLERFNTFLNSRAWELSSRTDGSKEGEWVARFDIGYLSNMGAQQRAEGLMRDYIMANPVIMQLYLDNQISGYNGEFSNFCTGIAEDNYFYRNATHGLVMLETVDDIPKANRTYHTDSMAKGNLSFRERVNIQRTWEASNMHVANTLFDNTSMMNAERGDQQEEEEAE